MEPLGLSFSPERLAQLVEALPVGVFILDRGGTAIYANATAKALLGRGIMDGDHAVNLAERYAAVVAGTDEPYPSDRMPIVRALAGERTTVHDLEVFRDGERICLEVTGTPIFDGEGEVVCAVAVFQDVTDRKRLHGDLEERVAQRTADLLAATAAAEQASRAKSLFLMNVSHELRTPLNHVIGFSELLAERIDDPRSRKLAETATASGRELLDKINDLIELARVETETARHDTMTFPFDDLLREVAATHHVQCDIPEPIGMLTANRDIVRRLLEEILQRTTHARAAIEADRVVVSIEAPIVAARLRALSHLFGETEPAEDERFRQQEIDLRLAITRAQARAVGGDLRVEGEVVRLQVPRA